MYGDGFFDMPAGYNDADLETASLEDLGNRARRRYKALGYPRDTTLVDRLRAGETVESARRNPANVPRPVQYPDTRRPEEARTMSTATIADTARDELRRMLPPGATVQTILRHVSRSGMTRAISPVVDGADVSYLVARADPTYKLSRHGGLTVHGCGMDMGFHLVYNLSHVLYPDGFECCGEQCPSNDHSNGDRDYTPHHHSSGGYALKQRWL